MARKRAAPAFCCSGDECPEEAGYGRFGSFCEHHAQQLAKLMLTAADISKYAENKRAKTREAAGVAIDALCIVDDCSKLKNVRSWDGEHCWSHRLTDKPSELPCAVPGCQGKARRTGRTCQKHTLADLERAVAAEDLANAA